MRHIRTTSAAAAAMALLAAHALAGETGRIGELISAARYAEAVEAARSVEPASPEFAEARRLAVRAALALGRQGDAVELFAGMIPQIARLRARQAEAASGTTVGAGLLSPAGAARPPATAPAEDAARLRRDLVSLRGAAEALAVEAVLAALGSGRRFDVGWGLGLVDEARLAPALKAVLAKDGHPLAEEARRHLAERVRAGGKSPGLLELLGPSGGAEAGGDGPRVELARLAGQAKPPTREELLAMLASGDTARRVAAASELGKKRSAGDLLPLRAAALTGEIESRLAAVYALGWRGNVAAVALLARLTDASEPELRLAAARALGEIGGAAAVGHLRRCLRGRDNGLRAEAVAALGRAGSPAARDLLRGELDDKDAYLRALAAMKLAEAGELDHFRVLSEAMADPDGAVRTAALRAMGLYRTRRAYSAIMAGLDDRDAAVRAVAAEVLASMSGPDSPGYLRRALRHVRGDFGSELRIAGALLAEGDPEAVSAVKRGLSSGEASDRLLAAGVLAGVRRIEDLQLFTRILADEDLAVRLAASRALVRLLGPGGAISAQAPPR